MYKQLPHSVKIGITRSITTSFTEYMKSIEWDVEKFDMQQFVEQWKQYLYTKSKWIKQINDDVKEDPSFHQELANRINEKISQLLQEEPTDEQLQVLQVQHVQIKESLCKLEAQYQIDRLVAK
ncbi:hypothetical protein H9I32_24250 [Bacillus sp. Xin]|uniref:hypothetical protein n=1 Tax=unclassified Bacillus (in: firmicutes) TaxID=185979 RepID=UPI0015732C19|nr:MULTISPECIES: hypothetical protein [unclassified Bacillus (in: firmicutes)]MBC6975363.1 hypothetical protein [Bacillus sp. Xin]NSW37606.1 hypothetical protein [Bacillus sp. Xin1]